MAINTVRTVERVVHLTRDHEAVAGVALCPPTAPRLVRESVPVRRPAAPWKPPMTGAMQGAIEALPMPGTYFALTLHEFASTDELRAALLEGTDIEELEPGADVSLGQQLRLNSNVSAREDSAWPLRLGRRYTPATHGALGFAAVSAPTLGEGLAVVERFAHVRMPLLRFHSRRDRSDQFSLVIGVRSDLPNSTCIPLSEMVMLSVQSLVAFMLGRRIVETSLQLAYPAPPHADRYADAFHGTARFGHPETSLTMPADWLDRQSPMADPLTYQTSLQQLEALHRRLESDDHIVVRVAQLIETHPTATLSFAEAAAHPPHLGAHADPPPPPQWNELQRVAGRLPPQAGRSAPSRSQLQHGRNRPPARLLGRGELRACVPPLVRRVAAGVSARRDASIDRVI